MKQLLCILPALMLAGCYTPARYPLQPGEKIIFNTSARAEEFRTVTGNAGIDATNRIVTITRPTWASAE